MNKRIVLAVVAGVALGGAAYVVLGLGDGDAIVRVFGLPPVAWPVIRVVGSLGMAGTAFTWAWVLTGNKKVRFAGSDEDRRAKGFMAIPQRAVVYVFRDAFVGKLVGMDILLDDVPIAQTRGKTFVRLELTPGYHVVSSVNPFEGTRVDLPVNMPADSVLYLEHSLHFGLKKPNHRLTAVGEQESQHRIRRCRLLLPTGGTLAMGVDGVAGGIMARLPPG